MRGGSSTIGCIAGGARLLRRLTGFATEGDTLTRMLGGTVPMQLKVTRMNEKFVY